MFGNPLIKSDTPLCFDDSLLVHCKYFSCFIRALNYTSSKENLLLTLLLPEVTNMQLLPIISRHYLAIQQTGNENTQTYPVKVVILIKHQILVKNNPYLVYLDRVLSLKDSYYYFVSKSPMTVYTEKQGHLTADKDKPIICFEKKTQISMPYSLQSTFKKLQHR